MNWEKPAAVDQGSWDRIQQSQNILSFADDEKRRIGGIISELERQRDAAIEALPNNEIMTAQQMNFVLFRQLKVWQTEIKKAQTEFANVHKLEQTQATRSRTRGVPRGS